MIIFHSYVSHYQRVSCDNRSTVGLVPGRLSTILLALEVMKIFAKKAGDHWIGFAGKILTGKSHDLHGKIWLVSGADFPSFVNPLR